MRHCTHPRIYVLTLWMFVSLLVSIPAISQDFTIRPLPTQQQLPVATVHCIFEDSKGYMWYGTMGSGSGYGGGVCRDNGYQLDTFLPSRLSHQPASDNITGIVETARGEILVGTAAGLFALSGSDCTLRQVLLADSLPTAFPPINALHTDPHGNVWVGSGKYICRLSSDMQPVALYPDQCNGVDCSIASFHTDRQGNLFALQWRGGLLRWDAAADSFEVVDWHYMASPVRMVDDAAADTYWVLTWGGGIVRMQMTGDSVSSLVPQAVTLDGYSRNRGYDLLRDSRHGMLWVSSPDDLYVYRVAGDTLCEVPTTAFLPESKKIVDQLCESRTGDIYVAGFSPHTFIIAPRPQDMVRHEVSPISASTGYPLLPDAVCFDGKRIWLYQGRQGLTLYDIDTGNLSLAPWKTTPIIVKAPHAEGIYTLRDDTVYHVYDKDNALHRRVIAHSHQGRHIRHLMLHADTYLWYATSDCLYRHSLIGGTTVSIPLPSSDIAGITVVPSGEAWCATRDGNVFCIGTKDTVHRADSLGVGLMCIAAAPDGTLWAVGYDGMVYSRLSTGEDAFTVHQRLSQTISGVVKDIVVDGMGHVWICSDQQVCEYQPQTDAYRIVRCTDPFVGADYFYGVDLIDATCVSINGAGAIIELHSSAALNRHPDDVRCAISSINVNGTTHQPLHNLSHITLLPHERGLDIRLTTFEHRYADKVSFAYCLSGVYDDWVYLPQGQNTIQLPQLPRGRHQLHVKATDRNGAWGNASIVATLHCRRPWYTTWPAILLYITTVAAIAYGLWYVEHRIRLLHRLIRRRGNLRLDEITLRPEEVTSTRISDEFLRKVIAKAEEHLDDADYNVEMLSSDLCMSRNTLYRKLQALTGMSPVEFIRDIRLKKAATLLLSSPEASIADVSRKVGFANPSYFTRCFKGKFGVLPKEYISQGESR